MRSKRTPQLTWRIRLVRVKFSISSEEPVLEGVSSLPLTLSTLIHSTVCKRIIALMLGRLGMSAREAITEYPKLWSHGSKSPNESNPDSIHRNKFVQNVREFITGKIGNPDAPMLTPLATDSQVLVNQNTRTYVFRCSLRISRLWS